MNLINSSSHFPGDQIININDHDHHHNLAVLNHHQLVNSSSSSSSPSSHIFLIDSTQDHNGYYHHQYLYQPHYQQDEKSAYHGGSPYEMIKKNRVHNSGLKLTLRPKKEDDHMTQSDDKDMISTPVKWLSSSSSSSKIRLTKSKTPQNPNFPASETSSSLETDVSSNTSSSYNNPIRVCADCNTTKTPLWRSGPKGPKSLCNACGIRQRKARRAMAAATASPTGMVVAASDPPPPTVIKKIKVLQHKEKKLLGQNGHSASQFKKRLEMAAGLSSYSSSSSSSGATNNKVGLEEFLINLSNNLSLHRVFPEDEKDAAILLMALSSGLVHG